MARGSSVERRLSSRARLAFAGVSALALAGALAGVARAEDTTTDKSSEVIVTGSRVARSTFTAPTPITVINQQEIQKLGLTNVASVMQQLPQNSNFFAANNVGLGNFNVGAQLANLRGLNPFFGTRTLTLIDTRRVVPTTTGGGVDVTLVPSSLVARTDVVTGGASAVYGSDAVAGVVNIILDTNFTGLRAQADYSQTSHGDGADWHASAAFGTAFAGEKGHFIIGGEYEDYDAIGICSKVRDWCKTNVGLFTNTGFATNGQPHYIIGANGTSANTSLTGMLAPCTVFIPGPGVCVNVPPVSGPQVQFNTAGNGLIPYDPGLYSDGAGFFGFRQGGDALAAGAYDTTTMRPAVRRWTGLAHVNYELAPTVTAFLEGDYARSEAVNPVANGAIGPYALQVGAGTFVGFHVAPDNAFLTPAESAAVGPNGAEFGRNMENIQLARNETNNTTWRVVAGLKGDLGSSWGWDVYGEYGRNINDQHLYHNVVSTFLDYALDAVKTPGGQIVCGVTIPGRTNPNSGLPYSPTDVAKAASGGTCTPINFFGIGNASQAGIDYAFRTLEEFSTYTQEVLSANVHGDLWGGFGAGAVKLAAGAEYRREHGNVTHNLPNQPWYTDYTLSYGLDYAGTTKVLEGYAEVNVPLLKDMTLFKYLEVDGAIRETSNKNIGTGGQNAGLERTRNFLTWKISGDWDLNDWLRLRATRSRDVRAAQFRELFSSYAVTAGGPFGSVNNPWNNGLTDPVTVKSGGDINLLPEKADTWTAGIVISPKSGPLDRLRLSADWYQITIKDAIIGPPFGVGAQNIVTQCFNGVQAFCAKMTGEGTTDILTIDNVAVNLQGFTTRGIDFEATYTLPLDRVAAGMQGDLNFRFIASYLYDMLFSTGLGNPVTNYAGQSGPTAAFGSFNTSPKWQTNGFITYSNGPFSGTVQVRYIGPGRFLTLTASGGAPVTSPTTDKNSINTNDVASAVYVNLAASYRVLGGAEGRSMELFGTINNLFDKDPPIAPGGNGYPTNPVYFDTYGMTWKVGVRFRY
jgi:outer membrane receptor protein involved in Fe transport